MPFRAAGRNNGPRMTLKGQDALRLAVQLTISQISQGIGLAEAVQFAARYHNVTCAAIEGELSRTHARYRQSLIPRAPDDF